MGYYMYDGFGGIFMLIFWVAIIFLIFWLVRGGTDRNMENRDRASEILKERYAKGEISKKEFDEMKKDLR